MYCDDEISVYDLIRDLFMASSITCLLWAVHRIGKGLVLRGRIKALDEFGDDYTPEEREMLIHRIKVESLRY